MRQSGHGCSNTSDPKNAVAASLPQLPRGSCGAGRRLPPRCETTQQSYRTLYTDAPRALAGLRYELAIEFCDQIVGLDLFRDHTDKQRASAEVEQHTA